MRKRIVQKMFAYAIIFIFFTSSIFLASCKNAADSGGGGASTPAAAGSTPNPSAQQQTLTFTFNDDSGNEVGNVTTQDTSITFADIKSNGNIQNPSKTGETFEGWFYGNNNATKAQDSDEFNKDTIFTAKFTPQGQPTKQKLTFKFESEGIIVKTVEKEVTKGGSVLFSEIRVDVTDPTKANHNFEYWTDSIGNQVNDSATFSADTTFTAKFTLGQPTKQTLTFTFESEGAIVKTVEKEVTQGGSVAFSEIKTSVTAPTKTNHNFDYWTDSIGNQVNDSATFSADTTFTAKFTEIKQTLTFTFVSEGVTVATVPKEVTQGGSVQFSDIVASVTSPTKTGNNFVGWVVGSETNPVNNNRSFTTNTTFTAKFTAKQTLTFTFIATGANPESQTITKELPQGSSSVKFSDIGVTPPSKAGHGFVGWVVGSSTTTVNKDTTFNTNTTFTAKFESAAGDDNRKLELAPGKEKAEIGDVVYKDGSKSIVGTQEQAGGKDILGYVYKSDGDGGVQIVSSNNVHASARWSLQNNTSAVYVGYLGARTVNDAIPPNVALLSDAVKGAENGFDAWLKIAAWHPGALFANYNAIATAIIEKKGGSIPNKSATDPVVTTLIAGTSVDDRWYLPTVAELIALYENMSKLPANLRTQLTGDFWTCELPDNPNRLISVEKTAKYVSFSGGTPKVGTADKYSQKNVIAVTQFMVKKK